MIVRQGMPLAGLPQTPCLSDLVREKRRAYRRQSSLCVFSFLSAHLNLNESVWRMDRPSSAAAVGVAAPSDLDSAHRPLVSNRGIASDQATRI